VPGLRILLLYNFRRVTLIERDNGPPLIKGGFISNREDDYDGCFGWLSDVGLICTVILRS